jgi:hypothetical protein
MCVVSMIMDARFDDWQRRAESQLGQTAPPTITPITPQEVEEFRRLLDRAREYDRKHGEPDCELEEKRKKIKDLAKVLGVEVEFV